MCRSCMRAVTVHVACLAGAAQLLADGRESWSGTLIALFQPAEETGDGARDMVDGLRKRGACRPPRR